MASEYVEETDRLVREAMKEAGATFDALRDEIVRCAGWRVRWQRNGYGAHVATRDSKLPRDLREWVQKGCPRGGTATPGPDA
jgi:hypothetical protein